MHPFNEILECLCIGHSTRYDVVEEQPAVEFLHEKKHPPQTTQSLAEDILSTLYAADTNDENLLHHIQDIVRETGWYDSLAAAVLTGLENTLKTEAPMGQAMRDAYDKVAKVVEQLWQFAKDHPVFVAVVALGILVVLAPWAIEVLGFGELGPIEGMSTSCWSLYTCAGRSWCRFFSYRHFCCLVAVHVWRLCACGVVVFLLPTTRNGVEGVIGHISPVPNSCGDVDEGDGAIDWPIFRRGSNILRFFIPNSCYISIVQLYIPRFNSCFYPRCDVIAIFTLVVKNMLEIRRDQLEECPFGSFELIPKRGKVLGNIKSIFPPWWSTRQR